MPAAGSARSDARFELDEACDKRPRPPPLRCLRPSRTSAPDRPESFPDGRGASAVAEPEVVPVIAAASPEPPPRSLPCTALAYFHGSDCFRFGFFDDGFSIREHCLAHADECVVLVVVPLSFDRACVLVG